MRESIGGWERILQRLEQGELLEQGFLSQDHRRMFAGFGFLTGKLIIGVANTDEHTADTRGLEAAVLQKELVLFHIHGETEMEIEQLDLEDIKKRSDPV